MSSNINIIDTTLRDGEQTAGVVFTDQEKLRIAQLLDSIGVHQIEAGVPVMGGDEQEAIKKIVKLKLKASIMGWNRAVIGDIIESLRCGVDAVAISVSTSDIHIKQKLQSSRDQVLDRMVKAVEFAKKEGVYVSVNAEDASRSEMEFLTQFAIEAKKAGANRLRYCDTVGIMEPFLIYHHIKELKKAADIDIEMHTHNDFGMATANALGGIKAGANWVGVTMNGLGERAGNAALEEVVMALKHLWDMDLHFKTERFKEVAEYVAQASGRSVPVFKAIVGSHMFTQESGVYMDDTIKNSDNYEPFSPEDVGLERQIVIGKHSGSKALIMKFDEYGICLKDEEAAAILPRIRSTAINLKRSLFDKEIVCIYEEWQKEK